jgi:hypothetical protein
MLTDPFYNSDPAYSGTSTGVFRMRSDIDSVGLLEAIKGTLIAGGWTVTDQKSSSTGTQFRPLAYFETVVAPLEPVIPVQMGQEYCQGVFGPLWKLASVGGVTYITYDPFRQIPPQCDTAVIYYPAGETALETAENLAAKITQTSAFLVTVTGVVSDPNMPLMARQAKFEIVSKADAYENDLVTDGIWIGAGSKTTTKGYYVLKSQPMPNGGFLEAKLQMLAIGHLGAFITIDPDAVLGEICPYITVRASAGGEFGQPVYPGNDYNMAANNFQFVLWAQGTDRRASKMLASMLKMDKNHELNANPVLVVGSESDLMTDHAQLTTKVHWEEGLATGFFTSMDVLGWRTQSQGTGNCRTPTMIFRGLRNMPLLTLSNTGFAEAPYVALAESPNGSAEDRIGGRPWDMLLVNDVSAGELVSDFSGDMIYDSRRWTLLSTSTRSGDLYGSLWVKQDRG